jgi:predicted amidohydrolase YtcJ
MGRFAASGAKALYKYEYVLAELKRCAILKLHAALESYPSTGSGQAPSQRTRRMRHPAVRLRSAMMASCVLASLCGTQCRAQSSVPDVPASAQTSAPEVKDSRPRADTIYIHANVYTGVPSNAQFSSILREEAVAVRGDRIQAVGKNAEIEKLKGPQTQVIDLGGHFVMPGFNDAHVHLADAGLEALNVHLNGVKTLDEFRQRVQAQVEKVKASEWILGGGWDETLWPVKTLPSRWDLDEVSGGHPMFLYRVDGHLAVANTRALQLASITIASKDPAGGKIDRDENGQPTGILREGAQNAVMAVIPSPTHAERRRRIEAALADLAEHGVTSAQDYSPEWENFQIYEEIEKEGKLSARISEWLPFDLPVDELKKRRDSHPQSDLMLHTGMLKSYMDGSLGGHTAALMEPYADDPNNSGLPQYDPAKLNEMAKERALAGFQLGFHAIGDKGVQMALDAFAEAEKAAKEAKVKAANGGDDFRLRVEHAEITTPAQIARFKELKVIASMQPCQLLSDMRWVQDRLGPKRAANAFTFSALLNKGVSVAFGTDVPFEPVTPFRGLYAAVTRKSENGKQDFFPEQRITMDQTIAAYTTGSAFAEFEEKEKGKIVPGMLADFVVLDHDVTAAAPDKVLATKVLRTVVGGKTVYERK